MERIRFTIAVEPEVHAAFADMAEAAGQSLSRAVGDWLRDTASSSMFVARKMRELRLSPESALRELLAFQEVAAKSLEADTGETRVLLDGIASGQLQVADQAAAKRTAGRRAANPPSSNTGGKGRQAPPKRAK